MNDPNKQIYDQIYRRQSFQLGGDSYSISMQALRLEIIEHYGAGKDVLDVGCATGDYLRPKLPLLRSAVGLDYTQRFLNEFAATFTGSLPANLQLVCADARDMPFPESSFDFAYSFATLYSIPEGERVVAELGRVLRPGGHVALEFGNQNSLNTLVASAWHKSASWAKPYHVRLPRLRSQLDDAGFDVVDWRCFQVLPLYAIPRSFMWLRPLSGRPLRGLLGRRTRNGRLLDEIISGAPGLRMFAFRHLVIARRRTSGRE